MDIRITFDVTPKLADLAERVCNALERKALFIPASDDDPGYAMLDSLFPRSKASDLPVETPEPSPVSKPVEPTKSEPDAKIEAPTTAIDETPAPEPKDETPVEAPKPKRSHHKKVERPADPEPQPEPEKPAEPEPVDSPAEPETDTDAAPEMSLDEVRAVCVQAAKAGKTKVVTDFLGAHNAQSLSKLDPKHYAKLAETVEAAL
jgi:outer membrane biosynthesis protein TonB